jgi:hypothetical protein
MKSLYRIILFIFICWFGYFAFRQTLGAQQQGLFGGFQYFYLVILIVLSLSAIVSDIAAYRSYSKWFQFYSSITSLLLCALIFFRLATFNKIETSKTIFTVSTKANSQNVLSIQFKENGYLRIEEFSRLGQDIFYGRYYQNRDTIFVTQTNYELFAQKLPFTGIMEGNLLIWNNNDTMRINNRQ